MVAPLWAPPVPLARHGQKPVVWRGAGMCWGRPQASLCARCALILASACVRPGLASWGVRLSPWA